MNRGKRLTPGIIAAVLGLTATIAGSVSAQDNKPDADEAAKIGVEAYVYGYPLVTMEMTRRVMTNVATVEATRGPMGQFFNVRRYPSPADRDVTAPNADTLYSIAWLDVGKEPYVLSTPDEDGRYFLMPMMSGLYVLFRSGFAAWRIPLGSRGGGLCVR